VRPPGPISPYSCFCCQHGTHFLTRCAHSRLLLLLLCCD
jgi:hypothetical protein